jgi:ATP-binding cassette subfamily C exporter for protease/lipase
MIAASVLTGRAMAPVDAILGVWKQFTHAKDAYYRLDQLLMDHPPRKTRIKLPKPEAYLSIENVVATPPGSYIPALRDVSLKASPGEIIAVIGPSASGKSTLSRVIVGAWHCNAGRVRLDGYDIHQWNKDELGPHIGYLPQDIELFDGTIAENICRFGEINSEKIIEAANKAGVHEMIQLMPQGYDTRIGIAGSALSGGQRQRIALARALYGNPTLIVLDEPNSNLDTAGESALSKALLDAKNEGKVIILVSHRPEILTIADKLCHIRLGKIMAFGTKEEVKQLFKLELQKQREAQSNNNGNVNE